MQKSFLNEPLQFLCGIRMPKMINRKHLGWSQLNMKMTWTALCMPTSKLINLIDQTSQRRTCKPQKNIIFFAFLLV